MSSRLRPWLRSIALALGVLVVLFAQFHDTLYRWLALSALHRFTGIDAGIDGKLDVSHGSPLVFDLSGLRVALAGQELEGPRGSIGSLHFAIRLLPLLSGVVQVKELIVRDAQMELFTLLPSRMLGSDGGLPVPRVESWALENVRVGFRLTESGARNELLVTRLASGAEAGGRRTVAGNGSLDGDAWSLNGELGLLEELLAPTQPFPVSMTIEVPNWGIEVQTRGTVGMPLAGKDLRLDLKASTDDLTPMLRRLLPETPFAGTLAASARLTGSLSDPLLSDLSVDLRDDERIHLQVQGATPLVMGGNGLDLSVTLTTSTPEVARYLTRERIPGIENLQVAFKARSDGDGYVFDGVRAAIAAGEGRRASYQGSLQIRQRGGTWGITEVAGALSAEIPTQALSAWIPENFPKQGRVTARATLGGDGTQLNIPSFEVELSGDGPLQGTAQGEAQLRVARLHPATPPAQPPVSEDLLTALTTRLDLKTANVQGLGKAMGTPLPDLGTGQAKATIQLQKGRYQLTGLDARTRSRGGLQGRVRGTMSFGALSREMPTPTDLKLQIDLSAPSVAAAKPLGVKLGVDMGPWTMGARVHGEKGRLKVDGYSLKAGENGPNQLQLDGKGGALLKWLAWDLDNMKQASMWGRLRLADTRIFGRELGLKVPDLGALDASFEARSEASGWALPRLDADIKGNKGITLKLSGSADGIPTRTRFRADLEFEATGKVATAVVTGGVLSSGAALRSKGKLEGGPEKATYKGSLEAGSTVFDADLALDLSGARPLVTGSLKTTVVNGADLGWPMTLGAVNVSGVSPTASAHGPSLLSRKPINFQALALADFELDITADGVNAYGAGIAALKLKARNRDRRLHVEVERAQVANGQLTGVIDIDSNRKTPKVTITTRSKDLSLHELHGWFGASKERMSGRLSHEL